MIKIEIKAGIPEFEFEVVTAIQWVPLYNKNVFTLLSRLSSIFLLTRFIGDRLVSSGYDTPAQQTLRSPKSFDKYFI